MLVALVAVAVLALVAVAGLGSFARSAVGARKSALTETESLSGRLHGAEEALLEAARHAEVAEARAAAAERTAADTSGRLEEAHGRLVELEQRLAATEERSGALEEQLAGTREELARAEESLAGVREELAGAYEELARADDELVGAREERARAEREQARVRPVPDGAGGRPEAAPSEGAAETDAAAVWDLERVRLEREWREVAGPGMDPPVPWDGGVAAAVAVELEVIREVVGTPSRLKVVEAAAGTSGGTAPATALALTRAATEVLRLLAREGVEMDVAVTEGPAPHMEVGLVGVPGADLAALDAPVAAAGGRLTASSLPGPEGGVVVGLAFG